MTDGRVAAAAKVKLLVLSHLVPGDHAALPGRSGFAGARQHHDGPIVVRCDLLEI
jgi:hypothetical protein